MYDLTLHVSKGGFYICDKTWVGVKIWFEHAKFYYISKGEGWVTIGDQRTVLSKGKIYYTPPRVECSYGCDTKMEVYWLHFYPQSAVLMRLLESSRSIQEFSKGDIKEWIPIFKVIPHYLEKGEPEDVCRVHAMMLDLMGSVLAKRPQEDPIKVAQYERLLPALQFLDSLNEDHPSLTQIAKKVSLSPEHFHRLFYKVFHITPFRYIISRRMTKARQLLTEARYSVSEVAEKCGYEDPFYFSRVFRKYYGFSPTEGKGSQRVQIEP